MGLVGLVGVVGWVVGPQDFHVILWHFENGASNKIELGWTGLGLGLGGFGTKGLGAMA